MAKPLLRAFFLLLVLAGMVVLLRLVPGPPPEPTPPPTPTPTEPTEPPPPRPPLERIDSLEIGDDLESESLRRALAQSLKYLARKDPEVEVAYGDEQVPLGRIRSTLEHLLEGVERWGNGPELLRWVEEHCQVYRSTADEVLFTGYHLASLRGSRERSERYRFPLYRVPDDMVRIDLEKFDFFREIPGLPKTIQARVDSRGRVVPYFSREEIDFQDRLAGKQLELLWADSLLDVQALHVQGSGVVELPDGEELLVGFADSNGRRFRGIGAVLLERGLIPRSQASPSQVNAFLASRPDLQREILSENTRYIFFRPLKGGPLGALGVEVTPHRSIATDLGLFPAGALALVETRKPRFEGGKLVGWDPFRRLVLNQDTGAAIKGTGRVDLYHGFGPDNERIAGSMHQVGQLYFLVER